MCGVLFEASTRARKWSRTLTLRSNHTCCKSDTRAAGFFSFTFLTASAPKFSKTVSGVIVDQKFFQKASSGMEDSKVLNDSRRAGLLSDAPILQSVLLEK